MGAGREASHLLCLALGTGVGGALLLDGSILHGSWGGAGEIGHLSVDWQGRECVCGGYGCLEQYASGTAIARRMNELLGRQGSPDQEMTTRETVARWLQGDPLASQAMNEAIHALGVAIASLIHVLNPQAVVIGGGVSEIGEPLFRPLREAVRRRAMPSLARDVAILPAYGGNLGAVIGAGLQAWEYAQDESRRKAE